VCACVGAGQFYNVHGRVTKAWRLQQLVSHRRVFIVLIHSIRKAVPLKTGKQHDGRDINCFVKTKQQRTTRKVQSLITDRLIAITGLSRALSSAHDPQGASKCRREQQADVGTWTLYP